ncbi:MAG: response regulator transcription factor [Myxococcota bacterium]|nr:response regulator transcription factor [Myxococcota bacterium]
MIRAVIADDHGIVREGLRRVLEAEADIQVLGEAADGNEAFQLIEDEEPDVAILDISMPRLGGLDTLERMRRRFPRVRVILLSVHGESSFIQNAVNLGADGYILKNGRADDIVSAVRAVVNGGSYFSPPVAREIVQQIRSPRTESDEPFSTLSRREREVLGWIAEGHSAKEVGNELGISPKTVEAHRTRIMRKLGARKATELVRYAVRHGLIEP